MKHEDGWIGVDLDGTLSVYTSGDYNAFIIGPPVVKMVSRVKNLLSRGVKVKIFTARANPKTETPERLQIVLAKIREWSREFIGEELEITCEKDYHMFALYDDRAVQVVPNTGVLVEDQLAEAESEIRFLNKEISNHWADA
jgi:hypothetical protein